jgi:2,5-diketo-D-gluconate reductase A
MPPSMTRSLTSTEMPLSIAKANFRSWSRAAGMSLLATSPLLIPDTRSEASISCSVVSKVFPSIVTDRRPSISRLTASGIRGTARSPTPLAALRKASRAPLGRPARRCVDAGTEAGARSAGTLFVMVRPSYPSVLLNDGNSVPVVGLGVWQTPAEETEQAVAAALAAGYRHVDTAAAYGNETEVGRAISASGIPRDDIYIVTKLWNAQQGYDKTLRAFDASMKRLGLDQPNDVLDLYLIHWPMPATNLYVDTFKAFANLRDQGRIRSIGVSNFNAEHLRILIDATGIVPTVNQIELHPLFPQRELREVHSQLGIATEAWSPLGQGSLLKDRTITAIAGAHGRTPAQILIRWHVQLGNIVIPKSVNPERIASNFDVFDFGLNEQDMASISALEDGTRLGPDPRTFNFTG